MRLPPQYTHILSSFSLSGEGISEGGEKYLLQLKWLLEFREPVTLMQLKQTKTYLRNDINPKHGRKNLTKFWVVPWISNQRALEEEAIFFLAVPTLGPASWANSATTTPKLIFRCYCILDNHLRLRPLPYTAGSSLFLTSVLCATSASLL